MRTRVHAQGDGGFTLLEVITTCLLLSILLGLSIGPWQGYRHARARIEARNELVAALRNAQVGSTSENVTYRVDFTAKKVLTYRLPVSGAPEEKRQYEIDDQTVTFSGPAFQNSSGVETASAYFYPRGSDSDGGIAVVRSDRSKVYSVSVEGLTARVWFTDRGVLAALRRREGTERGFSMVEILVAISLMGLLSAAIVPMLITGLRASVVAKLDTGAKNLSQQRLELMRNLPFRIAYDPAITTGVDLLDTYFPNLTAPAGGVNTAGYVTTQARRTGEPSTGPFYRSTFSVTLGSTPYTQYVATQFLNPEVTPKAPVTPPAGYSTTSTGADKAPSTLVGVTVVAEWVYGTESKR